MEEEDVGAVAPGQQLGQHSFVTHRQQLSPSGSHTSDQNMMSLSLQNIVLEYSAVCFNKVPIKFLGPVEM